MVEVQRLRDKKLEEDIEKMRKERGDLIEDARALSQGIKKLEEEYYEGIEGFGKSPEELAKLFAKFESNERKSLAVLDEINDEFTKVRENQSELEDLLLEEDAPIVDDSTLLVQEVKSNKMQSNGKLVELLTRVRKQHDDLLSSFTADIDKDIQTGSAADIEAALVPILQRKNNQLKKQADLAESKARSLTAQWYNINIPCKSICLIKNFLAGQRIKRSMRIFWRITRTSC